jgi:hypothetical protein
VATKWKLFKFISGEKQPEESADSEFLLPPFVGGTLTVTKFLIICIPSLDIIRRTP